MTERWLPIAGFDGAYQVSDHGRVRSLDRTITRRMRGGGRCTVFARGCVLQPVLGSHGYPQVTLYAAATAIQACVHVLVAAAFNGARPDRCNVLHRDGDKLNAAACNLYYGTQSANLRDAKRHGTIAEGERHGNAKLTNDGVRVIRASGSSQRILAAAFGVSQSSICRVRRRLVWDHVAAEHP